MTLYPRRQNLWKRNNLGTSWLAYSSTLKIKKTYSSETSFDYHLTIWRYIPEERSHEKEIMLKIRDRLTLRPWKCRKQFLRNVLWLWPDYMASYPRRLKSSRKTLFEIRDNTFNLNSDMFSRTNVKYSMRWCLQLNETQRSLLMRFRTIKFKHNCKVVQKHNEAQLATSCRCSKYPDILQLNIRRRR
jgi:hypothetical protein